MMLTVLYRQLYVRVLRRVSVSSGDRQRYRNYYRRNNCNQKHTRVQCTQQQTSLNTHSRTNAVLQVQM